MKHHVRSACLLDPLLVREPRPLLLPWEQPVVALQRLLLPDRELERPEQQVLEAPLLVAAAHPPQRQECKELAHEAQKLRHQSLRVTVTDSFQELPSLEKLLKKLRTLT